MYEKVDLGEKIPFWAYRPSFFLGRPKTVKFGVKMPKMAFFQNFQLWHLKTFIFSSPYGFPLFFTIFRPLLRKEGQIFEIGLILLIFKELAPAKPKQVQETCGTCHMANFRMLFGHTT